MNSDMGLAGVSLADEVGPKGPLPQPNVPMGAPWWIQIVPFFLSAFFFLSALFSIFSPLPLLFLHMRKGRKWAWLAALSNALVVGLAGGGLSLSFFVVFVVVLSLTLAELIEHKKSLEKAALLTLLAMAGAGVALGLTYAQVHHLNPIQELRTQVSSFVDYLGQSVSTNSAMVNPGDTEEWKKSLVLEFPSALAIFSLILVWANLVLLLRANPNGIREKLGLDPAFLKQWKAPEYLIWPTILTGFFLVVDVGAVSAVSLNLFKFLMAIYAIQGLSILSHFFDLWNIRGFFRWVGFSLSVFLMMPLVLSLGFFDLWFDFRGKFRQS